MRLECNNRQTQKFSGSFEAGESRWTLYPEWILHVKVILLPEDSVWKNRPKKNPSAFNFQSRAFFSFSPLFFLLISHSHWMERRSDVWCCFYGTWMTHISPARCTLTSTRPIDCCHSTRANNRCIQQLHSAIDTNWVLIIWNTWGCRHTAHASPVSRHSCGDKSSSIYTMLFKTFTRRCIEYMREHTHKHTIWLSHTLLKVCEIIRDNNFSMNEGLISIDELRTFQQAPVSKIYRPSIYPLSTDYTP